MALFKISKGLKSKLPTTYVEGYCYFTTDDGKFYIDTSNTASGRICLNANMADKLTSNAGSATQPVYFSNGKPVAITGNIANGTTGNAATATKATQDSDGNTINTTYLKRSGGAMGNNAFINWPDSGSWGSDSATFPLSRGGLYWSGTSDWIRLFAEETKSDMLNLVAQFGDDGNNGIEIRNQSGTTVVGLYATGVVSATTFQGTLIGNASTASKLATARTISLTGSVTGSGFFDGSGNLNIATTTNHTHNYAGSSSAGGIATSSYSLTNKGTLDTQEKIDNFLTGNKIEYATFKTSEANNVGMVSNDGMILSIPWTHTAYGAQIAFDDDPSGLIKIRGKSTNWGNWYTLLHSGNYNDYTVTKTGSGASGNWGINITGNASSATKATQDSAGQQINTTYIKGLSVSGKTITYTKGDGSTGTIATQDLNTRQTLYSSNYNLPLLMSYQTNTNTTANIDNVTFRNNSIYANPSTGMIAATSNKIGEHVTLQYDSTNECLNFVFS